MEYPTLPAPATIENAEEARQLAIDWQNWFSDNSISYELLSSYQTYFATLADKFNLTAEFQENGII